MIKSKLIINNYSNDLPTECQKQKIDPPLNIREERHYLLWCYRSSWYLTKLMQEIRRSPQCIRDFGLISPKFKVRLYLSNFPQLVTSSQHCCQGRGNKLALTDERTCSRLSKYQSTKHNKSSLISNLHILSLLIWTQSIVLNNPLNNSLTNIFKPHS